LAAPGLYTVRLTVDGHSYTQPLTFKMDPRVTTPAAGLEQLYALSLEMYNGARQTRAAYDEARAALERTSDAALKKEIEALAPAPPRGGGGRGGFFGFGRGGGPAAPPSLSSAANAELAAAMAMQNSDTTPTAAEVEACTKARAEAEAVLAKWAALKAKLGGAE
jgi:hypothetical protein